MIQPYLTKTDSYGDLVVKFYGSDVKTIVGFEVGQVELALVTIDDEEPIGFDIIASDTIKVKE